MATHIKSLNIGVIEKVLLTKIGKKLAVYVNGNICGQKVFTISHHNMCIIFKIRKISKLLVKRFNIKRLAIIVWCDNKVVLVLILTYPRPLSILK